MRAAVVHQHGGPERLVYEPSFPDPHPGPGEIVVKVRATSLNYHDVFTRRGMPGITIPMPAIMGLDFAGEVAEIGSGVEGWAPGDRVLVDPIDCVKGGLMGETVHGGLAERCRVDAHQLIAIPDGVSFEQAAALPVAYGTAHRMMVTIGRVTAGEKVLILGASGGVGTCCVFLAKMAGAMAVACGSTPVKLKRLREFGADHVIDYAAEDWVAEIHRLFGKPTRRSYTGGVDVVINYTGGDTWVRSMKCLRRGGRMLTCGATAGFAPQTDIRYIWTYELEILGSNGWTREDLETLLEMVRDGRLRPVIDCVLPLEEAREGLRRLEDREVIGKVVITP
jgi:alcohol dehydrogenase